MNRILLSSFICLILLTNPDKLVAQWVKTNGPYAGSTKAMIHVGNDLFAANWTWGGSDANVYKSSDYGETWYLSNNGFGSEHISMFTNIGSTVFAATEGDGIYRTLDGGANWSLVLNDFVLCTHAKDSVLFAGLDGYGVKVSYDLGQTWTVRNNGFSAIAIVYDIEHIGNYVFCCQETGGGDSARLYRSSNDGLLWEMMRDGLPPGADIHHLVANDTTLIASMTGVTGFNYGLYRSADYADNWTEINNGIPFVVGGNTGEVFAASNGDLYVSATLQTGNPLVYKSTDNGNNWFQQGNSLRPDQPAYSFTEGGGFIFAGTGSYSSVFRTNNGGNSWEESRKGLANGEIWALKEHNGIIYSGGREGLFLTTDGGNNWSEMQNGLPFGLPITAIDFNGSNIYLATDQYGVYLSHDDGNTWIHSNSGLTGTYAEYINDILFYNNDLYVATFDGIYKSTDNGNSWFLASNGLPTAFGGSLVNVNTLTVIGSTLFAGTTLEKVYKSTDGGNTWTLSGGSSFTIYSSTIRDLLTVGSDIYAATDDGVYISSDTGNTWTWKSFARTSTLASDGNKVFISNHGPTVLTGFGVFMSSNSGNSWQNIGAGLLPASNLMTLLVYNDTLYGGTDTRSVWKLPLNTITGNYEIISEVNTRVFPNPASEYIQLQTSLKMIGNIYIYSVSGSLVRKVSTPLNSPVSIEDLQEGMYIYRAVNPDDNSEVFSRFVINR